MSNILLAYNNRATGATFAGGSYTAGLPRSNLGTSDIDEVARTSSAALVNTRFRFDLTASRSLRTLSLTNHNLSTAAQVRLRTGRAVFDVDWASYIAEDRATFSGGAGGTRVTSVGALASATTPRITYTPGTLAALGLLTEEQRTNSIRNNTMVGAVAGTPGTLPTNWGTTGNGGLSREVVGTGTEDGIEYIDLRFFGTVASVANPEMLVTFDAATTQAAASGQSWTTAIYTKIVGGSLSGVSVGENFILCYTAALALSEASSGTFTYGTAALISSRQTHTRTLSTGTTAYIQNRLDVNLVAGAAVDVTIRIGLPQLELGAFASSVIRTSGAQVTRTADSTTFTSSNFTGIHSATAGTLYAEFNLLAVTGTRPIISLDDGTANERIELYASGTSLKFRVIDGGVTQCDITIGTIAANTFYKAAVAWSANDFTGCLSGTLAASPDTSGTLPTVDRMRVGSDQAGNYQNGHQKRTARFTERLTNAELQLITTSGIDALGYDSGWVNALRFSFIGDTPTNWGEQYAVMFAFDAITARYGTLEINDTANTAGYVQAGRLFVGGGFQPTNNAEYGRQRGRTDLSSSVKSISGKKYSTARRRPRTVDMRFPVLTPAEGNHLDEMADAVGTTEEVFYVPDPADMELSQRQGFLAHMRELGALEDSFYENVATPYRLEEKL